MARQLEFRRIVLGLPYSRPEHRVRLAAELARLLRLDLLGIFVEEESLRGLASLPFVREFQLLGGGWRPLAIEQLSRDLEIAAKSAERAFTEAAKTLQTACQFEIVRGSMVETIGAVSRSSDIVLIAEPENATESVTPQFLAILDAAIRSAASVLLVPGRIARRSGAIVAIAAEPGDPSIDTAVVFAAAANEELIIIETFESAGADKTFKNHQATGVRIKRIRAPVSRLKTVPAIESALQQVHERLVVMTRHDDRVPLAIASMRQVPILIIEPPKNQFKNERGTGTAA